MNNSDEKSIAQQEDIIGYDKMDFINGLIILNNKNPILDSFIKEYLYRNFEKFFIALAKELNKRYGEGENNETSWNKEVKE
ncbi:MAG: hypothetical protein OEV44_02930 [Spirochaetota bacterium]|nr:hypothetical protein [Spirochaetota bacterium]